MTAPNPDAPNPDAAGPDVPNPDAADRDAPGRYLAAVVSVLPGRRRDWGHAMRAELGAVDGPRERWGFALSCTRAAVTETVRTSALWRPAAVAGAVVLGVTGEIVLATLIGQTIPLVLVLAALAWLGRRPGIFGPVRADRTARVVRAGGYTLVAMCLVVGVIGGGGPGLLPASQKSPAFALMLTLYAGVFLAVTARATKLSRTGLALGAGAGLVAGLAAFTVMPFERIGTPLAAGLPGRGTWLIVVVFGAPAAAALLTGRRTGTADQGVMTALCAGTFAALSVAFLGLSAVGLFPGRVPDIVGPVMPPGSTAAERHANDAIEAADPYAGLLLFGALLAVILWVTTRPRLRADVRIVLLTLLGIPPVALGLSARHFPGASAIAGVTAAVVFAAALTTITRPRPALDAPGRAETQPPMSPV